MFHAGHALTIDSIATAAAALIALFSPDPRPGLVEPVDAVVAKPLEDSRRLFAGAMFSAASLLWGVGMGVSDLDALRVVARFRAIGLAVYLAALVWQIAARRWKRPPLYVAFVVFTGFWVLAAYFGFVA